MFFSRRANFEHPVIVSAVKGGEIANEIMLFL